MSMKKIKLSKRQFVYLTLFALLVNVQVMAQSQTFDKLYRGGVDSLNKTITKLLVSNISIPEHDYLLYFNIELDENGFTDISELYRESDRLSFQILNEIKKISSNWIKQNDNLNVVLTIFLVTDKESSDFKPYTITAKEYNSKPVVRGVLTPPIIINYFRNK